MATSSVIVGAGAFGLSTAIELRRRGHSVTVLESGRTPRPEASSTDVTKAIRMDYGADEFHMALAAEAIDGWRRWNVEWERPLYHEVGFALLASRPLEAGDFELEGFERLNARGLPVARLDAAAAKSAIPTWRHAAIADGYVNHHAGYAESGAAVAVLAQRARALGVDLREDVRVERLLENDSRVVGVETGAGDVVLGDFVIVAAGAWTPALLPWLSDRLSVVGQPVFLLRPEDPEPFRSERFPVWGFDLSRAGWYGFPALPDGTVKVARHGRGTRIDPEHPPLPSDADERALRAFLTVNLPQLANAPITSRRTCPYCDSWDGAFYIDHDPDRDGLVVAAGGSGHGFKFAPVLGPIVADIVEELPNRWDERFRWRPAGERVVEASRSDA